MIHLICVLATDFVKPSSLPRSPTHKPFLVFQDKVALWITYRGEADRSPTRFPRHRRRGGKIISENPRQRVKIIFNIKGDRLVD
jgi:hypothetical protein